MPKSWDLYDAKTFFTLVMSICEAYEMKKEDLFDLKGKATHFFYKFCFTCSGTLGPLCAFIGGIVA